MQPFALPNEQRDAEVRLQLPNPGSDIGLYAMELLRVRVTSPSRTRY